MRASAQGRPDVARVEVAVTETVESTRTETDRRVGSWLAEFADAVSAGDADRAAGLFADESYWRDLVSFTWNLITVEGPAGVAEVVNSEAARQVSPVTFEVTGEPT